MANRNRLRIFGLLVQNPDQTVSAVAGRLRLGLPLTSEYLRALESRGLLAVRRVGRRVTYRTAPRTDPRRTQTLVTALRRVFQHEAQPIATVFKLATAFTHPRRLKIFRALQVEPRTLGQIQTTTRVPGRALSRHLKKLAARGFITRHRRRYHVNRSACAFGRELARLAVQTAGG